MKIKSNGNGNGFPAKAGPTNSAVCQLIDRSHAPRGNASFDAPRHFTGLNGRRLRDAERPGRRYHAERGKDPSSYLTERIFSVGAGLLANAVIQI